MSKKILLLWACCLPCQGWSGEVKTLFLDGSKMGTVNLALGRSTVLSFEDPPQKIISGNKNYFNFEFVKNDLTIQPTDRVESNLFIYGKNYSWGFLLKFPAGGDYDDWVRVVRKPAPKEKNLPKMGRRPPSRRFTAANGLRVLERPPVPSSVGKGVWLVDFELINLSDKSISAGEIVPALERPPVCGYPETRTIFDRYVLPSGGRGRARMFCE